MTVPGVRPLVAVTYKSAIDDPHRIVKSKAAGALFGLTPRNINRGKRTSQAESRWPATRRCARCPKSRRRDGGSGEAVTRPVVVI